jgi:hypothetical protein
MRTTFLAAALLLASAAFADSPFISNDIKYKDAGLKPATGRSGGASIEALALLGKDGSTDLEISASGAIGKVQVKLPGDVTHNYHDVSGTTFTQRLTGLHRLAPVGVQVNVADGTRAAVVSASESVKLRPDLVVDHVSIRPHTAVGAPYDVTAMVREANGDVGARASCVLFVDGVEVDRANNIWVDAGDTVTCQLSYLFPAAGTSQVSVAVTGVSPADYDGGNQSSNPVAVTVYSSITELQPWTADAYDGQSERRNFSSSPWGSSETIASGWSVGMGLYSIYRDQPMNIATLKASVLARTDDRTLLDVADVPLVHTTRFDWYWDAEYRCAFGYFDADHSLVHGCSVSSPLFDSYTTVAFRLNGGESTYISRGWYRTYVDGQPADVHYDNVEHEAYGNPYEMGETASFRLQFSDGTNYWEVAPFMTLEPFSRFYEQPLTCWGDWCSSSSESASGRIGAASH